MQRYMFNRGFTLLELMVSVTVMAILLGIGVPSFINTLDNRRVSGAAEQLQSDLQYARSEAIKRNANVVVSLKPAKDSTSTTWCYGISTAACDCSTGTTCQLDTVTKIVNQSGFTGASLTHTFTGDTITFSPRSFILNSGTATFTVNSGSNARTVKVVVAQMGRVKLCSPSDAYIPGYATTCP